MLKKTITYVDFNDTTRTEDFYFNLSKAELAEMQLGVTGGYENWIQGLIDAKDVPTLMKQFKRIILKSYGVKSPDGRRFIKSEALSEEFSQTEAFSELYMELLGDEQKAAAFVNAIVPRVYADNDANAAAARVSPIMLNQ